MAKRQKPLPKQARDLSEEDPTTTPATTPTTTLVEVPDDPWVPQFSLADCKEPLFIRIPAWLLRRLDDLVQASTCNGTRITRTDLAKDILVDFVRKNRPKPGGPHDQPPQFPLQKCHATLYIRVPAWLPYRLDQIASSRSKTATVTRSHLVRDQLVAFVRANDPRGLNLDGLLATG